VYRCFVEYRIDPEARDAYLAWLGDMRATLNRAYHIYEGTDQPGLFVEVWEAESEEEAGRIQEERLDPRSSWSAMFEYVPGGQSRIHAWVFRPV
jgi:hypothetical protein